MRPAKEKENVLFNAIKKVDLKNVKILLRDSLLSSFPLNIYMESKSTSQYSCGYLSPLSAAFDAVIANPDNEDALEAMNLIIEKGGRFLFNKKDEKSILFHEVNIINAIYHDRPDLFKLIFDRLKEVKNHIHPLRNFEFTKALMQAGEKNYLETVKMVVEVEPRTSYLGVKTLNLLLNIAVVSQHFEMTRLLLLNGALPAESNCFVQRDEKITNLLMAFTPKDLFYPPSEIFMQISVEKIIYMNILMCYCRTLPTEKLYSVLSGRNNPFLMLASALDFLPSVLSQIILGYLDNPEDILKIIFTQGDKMVNEFKSSAHHYPDSLYFFANEKLNTTLSPAAQEMKIGYEVQKLVEKHHRFEEKTTTYQKISDALGQGVIENFITASTILDPANIQKKLVTFSQLPNFEKFISSREESKGLLKEIKKIKNLKEAVKWCEKSLIFLNLTYQEPSIKTSEPFLTLVHQLTALMENYVKTLKITSQNSFPELEYKQVNFFGNSKNSAADTEPSGDRPGLS